MLIIDFEGAWKLTAVNRRAVKEDTRKNEKTAREEDSCHSV